MDTSVCRASTSVPRLSISSFTPLKRSTLRAQMATFAPSSAKRRAQERVPPVTTATLFERPRSTHPLLGQLPDLSNSPMDFLHQRENRLLQSLYLRLEVEGVEIENDCSATTATSIVNGAQGLHLFGGFHAHGDRDFVKTGRHGKSELHHDESSFIFPSGNQRETRESSAPDRFRRLQGLNFLRKEAECRSR